MAADVRRRETQSLPSERLSEPVAIGTQNSGRTHDCRIPALLVKPPHAEPYFKYFDFKDFVTPHSGLIQIRKYAEIHNASDLLELFEKISTKTKAVREEIYRLLVDEFGYFE